MNWFGFLYCFQCSRLFTNYFGCCCDKILKSGTLVLVMRSKILCAVIATNKFNKHRTEEYNYSNCFNSSTIYSKNKEQIAVKLFKSVHMLKIYLLQWMDSNLSTTKLLFVHFKYVNEQSYCNHRYLNSFSFKLKKKLTFLNSVCIYVLMCTIIKVLRKIGSGRVLTNFRWIIIFAKILMNNIESNRIFLVINDDNISRKLKRINRKVWQTGSKSEFFS